MTGTKVKSFCWFALGLVLPVPLLALIDHTLVRQFGKAYWSLPREIGGFLGWPILSVLIWYGLRRTRLRALGWGVLSSGLLILGVIIIYFSLMYLNFIVYTWTHK